MRISAKIYELYLKNVVLIGFILTRFWNNRFSPKWLNKVVDYVFHTHQAPFKTLCIRLMDALS